jgi:hypothetical protein
MAFGLGMFCCVIKVAGASSFLACGKLELEAPPTLSREKEKKPPRPVNP